jgi:hypothetical protein
MEAKERAKESGKEGLSRVSSVASIAAVRPSPLRREMDEGVGAREYIMSVGSTGSRLQNAETQRCIAPEWA